MYSIFLDYKLGQVGFTCGKVYLGWFHSFGYWYLYCVSKVIQRRQRHTLHEKDCFLFDLNDNPVGYTHDNHRDCNTFHAIVVIGEIVGYRVK